MRTQLELWEIVRDNLDKYWHKERGLCFIILKLFVYDIISTCEKDVLFDDLNFHGDSRTFFLGKKGDPKPRKEFIEKMIKKHKNIL